MKHVPAQHAILRGVVSGQITEFAGTPLVWALGYLWRGGYIEVDSATFENSLRVTGITDMGREVLASWDIQYGKVEV